MCTIRRKIIIITSYDVSIGSWLDLFNLFGLDWLDHHKRKCKVNSCKVDVTACIHRYYSSGAIISMVHFTRAVRQHIMNNSK